MQPEEYELMYRAEDAHFWYRALRALQHRAMRRHVADAPVLLLDIGCGTGASLEYLPDAVHGVGIDAAPEALLWSGRRGLTRLARASAVELPFPGEAFDCALMMDVLYHRAVPDRAAALREAGRVLRPGGTLLVNVPAYAWLYSSHDEAVHTGRRFTRRELLRLLRQSGFDVLECSYWNTLLFPGIALARLLRRGRRQRGSDLADTAPAGAGTVLPWVFCAERFLMRFLPLPFGLSVFAVARKPRTAMPGQPE